MSNILEVCCGSYYDALQAQKGGARRIELNSALHLGGLTPSLATLLKVKELMHKGDELPLAHENDSIEKVINIMIEKPLGCVAVLDKNDSLVGIITDGDFKRKIIQYKDLMSKKIVDIMTPNPITINKDAFALDAVKMMKRGVGENNNGNHQFHLLVVLLW